MSAEENGITYVHFDGIKIPIINYYIKPMLSEDKAKTTNITKKWDDKDNERFKRK